MTENKADCTTPSVHKSLDEFSALQPDELTQ